jgi:hypothetical protein
LYSPDNIAVIPYYFVTLLISGILDQQISSCC